MKGIDGMQRILHVIGRMDRAGAETLIMNIYRNIDRTRFQFDFMVFTDTCADYDEEIERLGGHIYHMPKFTGINYPYLAYKVNEFFKTHNYSIVHGHIGSIAPMYLAIAKKHGSFTIAHSHSANSSSLLFRTVFMTLAWSVRYVADYFFACSYQAGLDRFGKEIVQSDRFEIINNGIDAELYRYSEQRHKNLKAKFKVEDKMVVGHVGRFTYAKNHIFLIDTFCELHSLIPDSILMMAGRGEDEEKIQEYVKNKHLQNSVVFLGVRNDVPDLMNLFDCFVFPSHSEGLGIVAIEAQAAGLPCFMSNGIPTEAIVSDHAWRYDLALGAVEWAKIIKNKIGHFDRKYSVLDIEKAGDDIKTSVRKLEMFYESHNKNYE